MGRPSPRPTPAPSLTGQKGSTGVYSLSAGEQNLTVDAGLVPTSASLGDKVFVDNNKNGIQDAGDTPLAGVTVTLISNGTRLPRRIPAPTMQPIQTLLTASRLP
ncbi:MAG: hypothetical protein EAZ91_17575 [Cytophagales bacterium]|nr:MAG: hypothetical protein EAZ91_17575 [Cytophagales bacterium]